MKPYQYEFIKFALAQEALLFGDFTLKSGRKSPYFFNSGCFNTGGAIAKLGQFYAEAIKASGMEFDTLFGPAYKGIPLVTATAIALAEHQGIDKPYAFNRKEVKGHGEGGMIVGAPLKGRILLIDDVITAGVTINEAAAIIHNAGANFSGICISVDRQERGQGELSAIAEVASKYQLPILHVVSMSDIMDYLSAEGKKEELAKMEEYRAEYGVAK